MLPLFSKHFDLKILLMKYFLPLLLSFLSRFTFAQVNSVMPPEANHFYQNAMVSIKPDVKNLIEKNANKLVGHSVNVDSLIRELHKNAFLITGNEKDLEAVTVLILVQISKNTDKELKDLVIHTSHSDTNNEKYKTTAALLAQNKSNIAETVSLLMKKISGSAEIVIDKLK